MKAVVDTNILISGLINLHHAPGRILDMLRSEQLMLVVDDRILAEYGDVLFRERMRAWITIENARNIMSFLISDTERIVSTVRIMNLPDIADAQFIEAAITADVPLITGNLEHFPESLCRHHSIVSPTTFLKAPDSQ